MSTPIPYLVQGKNIIMVVDGRSHTISKDTHISYHKIVDALKNQDWDSLRDLVEPKKAIVNFGKGYVSIDGDKVLWKGQPFHNALSTRMIEMYLDGFPIDPMIRLMENLMENPSKRSVDQFYGFLEKNKLPITEDGHFLAFKKVRYDYLDVHSGTINNSIGQVVQMDRNLVDDNPDSHCSTGLHFCSESYLQHFGNSNDPVMILKINPADVVSIPTDYNGAKGRCSRYVVVDEVKGALSDSFGSAISGKYTNAVSVAKTAPSKKATPAKKAAPLASAPWPSTAPTNGLYQLYRVNGGNLEYSVGTLQEALALVTKHKNGKKAALYIVDPSGVRL